MTGKKNFVSGVSVLSPTFRLVAAALLLAGSLLVPQASRAQSAGEPFYKDKTLRMVVGSAAGGGYDTYGRVIADHIRKHIPGNPAIIIQNMPGAGSLIATNYLANVAPRDGTVIGAVNPLMATQPLFFPDRAKFDPRKFAWIGSALRENHAGVARSDSPVNTFDDLFSKELIIAGTGGATNSYPALTNAILGTHFKVVSGYKGTSAGMLALERGEVSGVVGITYASVAATQAAALRDGRIKFFVQFGLKKHPDIPNVPWIFDYAKTPDDKAALNLLMSNQEYGRPIVAPPGVPDNLVAILRKAFDDTMADPEFLADAERRRVEIDATRGEDIAKLVADTYNSPQTVIDRVKPILEKFAE
jgi:tripartite-type tricarboxylate transporter receptor subunit TctC